VTAGMCKFVGEVVWESVWKVEGEGEGGLQGSATGGCPLLRTCLRGLFEGFHRDACRVRFHERISFDLSCLDCRNTLVFVPVSRRGREGRQFGVFAEAKKADEGTMTIATARFGNQIIPPQLGKQTPITGVPLHCI
jgi:hypothetical protein